MKRWLIRASIVLGLIAFALVVWFAFPLIGFGAARPFDAGWVRALIIAAVLLAVGITWAIRWRRARRAAQALEEAIAEPAAPGDSAVLSERMTEALEVLKTSSGSKAYLYELPWYVIIGPPGAGKTTALLNSGIKFPLADKGGAVAGVGGTRYCDWWFAEDAVLIDTAGRYTTQDSDAEADRESWLSFLTLLKTHRARQPINGVILAIGLDEIMTADPAALEVHAATLRQRLIETREHLKVDFPVYVLFTKADLVAGFMEYFGAFSVSRRQKVWGATFQTRTRGEPTVQRFAEEFDALVARLSEEVTDRMNEEPDGVARIAIFGFPGQVAMLKDRLQTLLSAVFESSRYKVDANLRGFYFSSGTQEGNPIDQVLGVMQRSFGGVAAGGFMSGKGKSFFLHDLLTKVIFAESGWVSFDRRAVRREAILRYGALAAVALATVAMLGLWGTSFWQNRQLVRTAEAALADYELAAQEELSRTEIADPDPLEIAGMLQMLRDMPLGYGDQGESTPLMERFGLSQRERLRAAATDSYQQALERMFRARLILRLEQQLQDFVTANDVLAVYEALKVYKLLGQVAPKPDDQLVVAWFREDWRTNLYPGPTYRDARAQLEQHLWDMLELDGTEDPSFELNGPLIDEAERTLARMNVADQAYLLIQGTSEFAGVEDFRVALRAGPDADLVFETLDGAELGDLVIPAIYSYSGFHDFFLPQLAEVAQKLTAEQWVLGDYAETAAMDEQIGRIGPQLLNRYTDDFIAAWDAVLDNIKLKPMAADKPAYRALSAAAAPRTSPIYLLTEAIMQETQLTREFEEGGGLLAGGDMGEAADEVQNQLLQRARNRATGLARIGLDVAIGKSQRRAGAAFSGGAEQALPGAGIEAHFRGYHDLFEGDAPSRRIDQLIATLGSMQQTLILAEYNPSQASAQLPAQLGSLTAVASRLPDPLARMVGEAVQDFEDDAANTDIARLNQELSRQVTQVCEEIVKNKYPFARSSSRDVPMADFAKLFAPNGIMDRFFTQNLMTLVDVTAEQWTWRDDTRLADKLSVATLRQFQRAAEIRDAFFPQGGAMPNVAMTIQPTSMHNRVRSALLEVNGQVLTSQRRGNVPQQVLWPGSMANGSVSLQLMPDMSGRQSSLRMTGPWAFMHFLDQGGPRLAGETIEVRYTLGGRYISYAIRVGSVLNPFYLRALSDFDCPSGL